MIDYNDMIKAKWYAQGFNCTPLMLIPCGHTGFEIKEVLGDVFRKFIYEYKEDQGKMYYSRDDLDRLGELIVNKIKADKRFLNNIREKYEKEFNEATKDIGDIEERDLSSLSDLEIVELLKKVVFTMKKSVGDAHIIEPFALSTDVLIRDMLSKYIQNNKELNIALSVLSTPPEKSFVNESEEELFRVSQLTGEERKKGIQEYIRKFFWIRNTYSGRVKITSEMVEEELKSIKEPKPFSKENIISKQKEFITKYGLDDELIMLLDTSNYVTIWQDARKKNIFLGVDYVDRVLEDISRRTGIEVKFLRYLYSPNEINNTIFDPEKAARLEERRDGVVFMVMSNEEKILVGDDYVKFHTDIDKTEKKNIEDSDFRGMTASTGVGIGPARVCKSIEDINNFQEGEVLVASMTRPEFTPAMKKAVAIVTDEGGITSHAAIVSRELGVPCVIGTKVATKTIKNGDRIEVKANHGLVRILERAKNE